MGVSVGGATTTSVKICNRKKEKDRNGYHALLKVACCVNTSFTC